MLSQILLRKKTKNKMHLTQALATQAQLSCIDVVPVQFFFNTKTIIYNEMHKCIHPCINLQIPASVYPQWQNEARLAEGSADNLYSAARPLTLQGKLIAVYSKFNDSVRSDLSGGFLPISLNPLID